MVRKLTPVSVLVLYAKASRIRDANTLPHGHLEAKRGQALSEKRGFDRNTSAIYLRSTYQVAQ
jgi:hypothetical protein